MVLMVAVNEERSRISKGSNRRPEAMGKKYS